ncbi:MAG: hypothetical protein COA84_01655 [Robiginitomaculum sp.]|nr:MAG: hypothetical protein COA84_01655 [Robiginitomaculum sp.]
MTPHLSCALIVGVTAIIRILVIVAVIGILVVMARRVATVPRGIMAGPVIISRRIAPITMAIAAP